MEARQIRGYSLLAKGDEPLEIGKNAYRVPSQNGGGNYIVERRRRKGLGERWNCTCPDYRFRHLKCKHIYAVEFWMELSGKAIEETVRTIIPPMKMKKEFSCPFCHSKKIIRKGKRKCKNQVKQRYLCRDCGKRFIQNKEFEKIKVTPEVLTAVLDLYFKGVSLRKVADHLAQIHHIQVGKSTIHRWILDYMEKINGYVENLTPQVGGMWHTDEMAVKVGGEWEWLWNTIDNQTKFMLANNITKERFVNDAGRVFSKAKEKAGKDPYIMVTDGLQGYQQAFKNEFYNNQEPNIPKHIHLAGIKKRNNNNVVERYHGTVRERDKVMRGLKSKKTAEIIHNGIKDYYNFVRVHQGLGKTPAEVAGIDLGLKENRWLDLLERSVRC